MKDFKLHTIFLIAAVIISAVVEIATNGVRILGEISKGWGEQGTSTTAPGISATQIIILLFLPVFVALTTWFWMIFYKLVKAIMAGEIFDLKMSVMTRKMAYLIFAQYGVLLVLNIDDFGEFFPSAYIPAIGCGMLIISEIMHIVRETKEENDLIV